MKSQTLLVALAATPAAFAHTVFTNFYNGDGVSQGDGVAIRMNPDAKTASSPVKSLDSNDMACNVGGEKGVSRVQSIKDGSTLTFEIRSWPNDPSKERLDRGHKGPCAVYLKKVDSAVKDQGHGDGWFKIFAHGYEKEGDAWCTDKIIDNNGLLSVALPKGLQGGYYLARPEILALHAAADGDPQFYTGCAQIFLESSGNLGPAETVSIPGYVKYGQKSTSWNIYYGTKPEDYPLPGPKVSKLTARSSTGGNADAQTSQKEGLKPAGCIVENGNWCGKEVPDYSDEKGCWAAAENCWDQTDVCYDSALPTGNSGCKIMSDKCTSIGDACKAKDFNGPKNKGKVLTPKQKTIQVGKLLATQGAAAAVDETPKTSAAEAKTSAPAAPKSTSAPKETPVGKVVDDNNTYGAQQPAATSPITVPASEEAPAPTGTAKACPAGYECVTVYTTIVETKVEYKTVYADYRRRSVNHRRHGHA